MSWRDARLFTCCLCKDVAEADRAMHPVEEPIEKLPDDWIVVRADDVDGANASHLCGGCVAGLWPHVEGMVRAVKLSGETPNALILAVVRSEPGNGS